MPEKYDFFLVLRQFFNQFPDVKMNLLLDKVVLNIFIGHFSRIENIHFKIIIGQRIELFFLPEMIDDKIVGDANHPGEEPAIIFVLAFLQGMNNLNKGVLENILCQLLVLYYEHDIGKYSVFMAIDQDFNTRLPATHELLYEFVISFTICFQNYLLYLVYQSRCSAIGNPPFLLIRIYKEFENSLKFSFCKKYYF